MKKTTLSRRVFLGTSLIFGVGAIFWLENKNKKARLYANETQVLLYAAYHLFPHSTLGPGAKDFNISSYLVFVLEDKRIMTEDRDYFLKGAFWLEENSFDKYNTSFLNLDYKKRDELLEKITQHIWGQNFIYTCLSYIFEALLSSPVYGSNVDGMGWKWLEHSPGYPQPQSIKETVYEV